jgi:hypothetical protein
MHLIYLLCVVFAHILGVTPMKPGSCAFPYYGLEFAIVDPLVCTHTRVIAAFLQLSRRPVLLLQFNAIWLTLTLRNQLRFLPVQRF